MHIVIGLITALAGLFWALTALNRSGFSFDSINPFLYYRRAQWRKKFGTKPLYTLERPVEVAAVLLMGTIKCEGELSNEQKDKLLETYTSALKLPSAEASDLMVACSHLLRDEVYIVDQLHHILERSLRSFGSEQAESLVAMMQEVADFARPANEEQKKLVRATRDAFKLDAKPEGAW